MRKNIPSLQEALKNHKDEFSSESKSRVQSFRKRLKRTEQFYCFIQECLGYNFAPSFNANDIGKWYGDIVTITNMRDFCAIHKIVGTLKQTNMTPLKDDARCRDVMVTLQTKDENNPYSFIKFQFKKKLPRGSKCKVEKVVRADYRVVCDR